MYQPPGAGLGYEVIDRGITFDASGSRTVALTCLPAVTGAVNSGSPVGGRDGDTAVYLRSPDTRTPRRICFFRFSKMQNYHLLDDPGAAPFAIDSEDDCIYHLTRGEAPDAVNLARINFQDLSVYETTSSLPAEYALTDNGACAGNGFYFFALKDGIYYLARAPLSGGEAGILGPADGVPVSVAVTRQAVYFTTQPNVPEGLDQFRRAKNPVSLYVYTFAGQAIARLDTPPLYGHIAGCRGVLCIPAMAGGLYFPSAGVFAAEYVIDRVSLSHDGKYFVFTTPDDDLIYAGSVATGRARALNRHKSARGAGWHNQPSCAFTGDRRWVVYGSNYTNVPQAYAAYVPNNFLEDLD